MIKINERTIDPIAFFAAEQDLIKRVCPTLQNSAIIISPDVDMQIRKVDPGVLITSLAYPDHTTTHPLLQDIYENAFRVVHTDDGEPFTLQWSTGAERTNDTLSKIGLKAGETVLRSVTVDDDHIPYDAHLAAYGRGDYPRSTGLKNFFHDRNLYDHVLGMLLMPPEITNVVTRAASQCRPDAYVALAYAIDSLTLSLTGIMDRLHRYGSVSAMNDEQLDRYMLDVSYVDSFMEEVNGWDAAIHTQDYIDAHFDAVVPAIQRYLTTV